MTVCRTLHLAGSISVLFLIALMCPSVIENVANQVSVHGTSTDGKSVCLLVKSDVSHLLHHIPVPNALSQDGKMSINSKCTDGSFLGHLLDEVKAAF